MSKFQRWLFILAVVAVGLATWMGRYSLVIGVGEATRILVLDRWTGNVYVPRISETPAPYVHPGSDVP